MNKLTPAQQGSWIVSFMVSQSVGLRTVGLQFFREGPAESFVHSAFSQVEAREAGDLCDLLAGTGAAGRRGIRAVLVLLVARAANVPLVELVLLEEAAV